MKHPSLFIGTCIALLIGLAITLSLWTGLSMQMLTAMMLTVAGNTQFSLLGIGCALVLIALVAEWNVIRAGKKETGRIEVHGTVLLTIVFAVLFGQFVAQVYAASFSLFASSTEVKKTFGIVQLDIDNDGDLDYIAANEDGLSVDDFDQYISSGGSYTQTLFGDSNNFARVLTGDMNGDGYTDIVTGHTAGSNRINVYLNNGGTGFAGVTARQISTTFQVADFAILDVDNDGDLDIVNASSSNAINQAVWLNNGVAGFTNALSSLPRVRDMRAGDINGDGYVDLVISNSNGSVSTYKNSGTGAFIEVDNLLIGGQQMVEFALGDMDGDGDVDVFAGFDTKDVATLTNDGIGNLSNVVAGDTTINSINGLALGDIDNDGDLDALTAEDGRVESFVNGGNGAITGNDDQNHGNWSMALGMGDLDADGDLDYIVGNQVNGGGGGAANGIYTNDQASTIVNNVPGAPSSGFTASGSINRVTSGPLSPATSGNAAGTGSIAWTNTNNIFTSDNSKAIMAATFTPGSISNYLEATNFGFSIPPTASVAGIKVEWEQFAGALGTVVDQSVRVIQAGSITSGERAKSTSWPFFDTYSTYGGASDLWGATWTPAQINAANFGAALAVRNNDATQNNTPAIDHVRVTVYYATTTNLRLRWGSGSDDITPLRQLQYQVRVGTGTTTHNIMPPKIGSPNYTNRLLPNNQSRTAYLKNLSCAATYYWGVKTVDSGFRVSNESTEQTITLDSSCGIPVASPPPPPPPAATGGGTLWRMEGDNPVDVTVTEKTVNGRLFLDLNGDGEKSLGERWLPLKNVVIKTRNGDLGQAIGQPVSGVEGRIVTAGVNVVEKAGRGVKTDQNGWYELTLGAGTHSLIVEAKSLTDMEMTLPEININLDQDPSSTIDIPLRWKTLVRHEPCMKIGSGDNNWSGAADPQALLASLLDLFGSPALKIGDEQGLVQREDFTPLLAKTQCVTIAGSSNELRDMLKKWKTTAFADLPLSDAGKVLQTYGLVLSGVKVGKTERVFDRLGYVTRAQMVTMVAGAMKLDEWKAGHQELLAETDIPPDAGAAEGDVEALIALDVLPSSMRETFAGGRGVTWGESNLMLARAAFAAGRIDMRGQDEVSEKSFADDLGLKACWTVNGDRARNVVVRDSVPGSRMAKDAGLLMGLGAVRGQQTAWLIPGSSWMTDLGVTRGSATLRAGAPVSVAETLRELLVFACLPPPSRAEVIKSMAERETVETGSAGQLLKQDLISGVRVSASFVSRVLLTAQRTMRIGNLSPVFSFTDALIGGNGKRDPLGPVSVEEGAQTIASTVLGMLVRQGTITRVQAEGRMSELGLTVRVFLLNGREEAKAANTALTRGDLVRVMAAMARGALGDSGGMPTLGENWWARLLN